MKTIKVLAILVVLGAIAGAGFIYSGVYNMAADEPHWRMTFKLIETVRERSIETRAQGAQVPNLDDPQLISEGAEHYSAMCTGCHLAPGMQNTELRAGLYPEPPNLAEHKHGHGDEDPTASAARTFWVIKHGLKMTAMPAWGTTHDDAAIWGMVAFLGKLPELSASQYAALTSESGGHSHGSEHSHGEAEGGDHAEGEEASGGHSQDVEGDEGHSHGSPAAEGPENHGHGEAAPTSVKDHVDAPGSPPHSHGANAGQDGAASGAATLPAEPRAVAERFTEALAAGDEATVRKLLLPQVLIFESGAAEHSTEEYAGHHMPSDMAFLRAMRRETLAQQGGRDGSTAWVATRSRLSGQVNGKAVDLDSTETLVLDRTDEGWRIAHVHWSSSPR